MIVSRFVEEIKIQSVTILPTVDAADSHPPPSICMNEDLELINTNISKSDDLIVSNDKVSENMTIDENCNNIATISAPMSRTARRKLRRKRISKTKKDLAAATAVCHGDAISFNKRVGVTEIAESAETDSKESVASILKTVSEPQSYVCPLSTSINNTDLEQACVVSNIAPFEEPESSCLITCMDSEQCCAVTPSSAGLDSIIDTQSEITTTTAAEISSDAELNESCIYHITEVVMFSDEEVTKDFAKMLANNIKEEEIFLDPILGG